MTQPIKALLLLGLPCLPSCAAILLPEDDRIKADAVWEEQLRLTEREERRLNQYRSAWDRSLNSHHFPHSSNKE